MPLLSRHLLDNGRFEDGDQEGFAYVLLKLEESSGSHYHQQWFAEAVAVRNGGEEVRSKGLLGHVHVEVPIQGGVL